MLKIECVSFGKNALPIIIYSEPVLIQKLNYIHENPVKVGLCKLPEEYEFSSVSFYIYNDTKFDFLFHI